MRFSYRSRSQGCALLLLLSGSGLGLPPMPCGGWAYNLDYCVARLY